MPLSSGWWNGFLVDNVKSWILSVQFRSSSCSLTSGIMSCAFTVNTNAFVLALWSHVLSIASGERCPARCSPAHTPLPSQPSESNGLEKYIKWCCEFQWGLKLSLSSLKPWKIPGDTKGFLFTFCMSTQESWLGVRAVAIKWRAAVWPKEIHVPCLESTVLLGHNGTCWRYKLARSKGRCNQGCSVCPEQSDLLTRGNHAHSGKCLEIIFQIPWEGALLVLWETSLCLHMHEVSKTIK